MVADLSKIILFSTIIFLIGYQNVAIGNQSINLSVSPSDAYVGETTNFTLEFVSNQNLSNSIMHFYVDAEEKGAKEAFNIEKNKKYFITFDYYFNKDSYLGEHYIELKTDFVAENQEEKSESFYNVVNVSDNKKRLSPFLYFFLIFFVIALIGSFVHFIRSNNRIIKFGPDNRKILYSFVLTILPFSISIFTLYFTGNSELKIGMFSILISFIMSFFLAIFMFKAQSWNEVDGDKVAFYSLCFLLLGLIEMVILVYVF